MTPRTGRKTTKKSTGAPNQKQRRPPIRIETTPALPKRTATAAVSLPRTYTGLLDDVMIRYSTDYLGETFFNKMITKNLLFGGGLFLNDGYLVNHPVARRYLRNEDSLLRRMIGYNFIRILTRTNSPDELATMPENMAKSGNESFQKLIALPEWHDMQPLYDKISHSLYHLNNVRGWPSYDMTSGFYTLINRMFSARSPSHLGLTEVSTSDLSRLQDLYYQREPLKGNARDKFEKAVKDVVKQSRRPKAAGQLMDIANQAYHYNFGLTLTAEEPGGVGVDTTIGNAFDELLETREVSRGQIDGLALAQVPESLPFEHGELFVPFLDPASTVGDAKSTYLANLRALLDAHAESSDAHLSDLKKDVREATEDYLNAIESHFAAKVGRLGRELMKTSITLGVGNLAEGPANDSVVATSAPTAGLAITLQARATAVTRQFLVERFRLVDATADFNPSRKQLITLGDIRPQLASLAFNPKKAAEFVSTMTVMPKKPKP